MSQPRYSIPGVAPATPAVAAEPIAAPADSGARSIAQVLEQSQVQAVLAELERDLIGLAPVKARIRDIAALLVIDKLRTNLGLASQTPSLHMCFTGNPGMSSRIAHHLSFPDYHITELQHIAQVMLQQQNYRFDEQAAQAFERYLQLRIQQPHFANARSVRNALDRARLRQASRLFAEPERELTAQDLSTLSAADILASRLFHPPQPQETA